MDSLPSSPPSAATAVQFVQTFPKRQGLALVTHGTRCGRAWCRCSRGGQLHETAYLRWREAGKQRRRYVRKAELEAVRDVLMRRRLERRHERMTWQDAARLLARLDATYRTAAERLEEGIWE